MNGENPSTESGEPPDKQSSLGEPSRSENLLGSIGEIDFRQATSEDAEAIQHLLEPYVIGRKLLRRTTEEIAALTRHAFVAVVDDSLVGFCAVEVYSRKLAEIQALAVVSRYQGRGIGRRLVMLCLDRARQLDVMEVLAISASDDFLKSCGFDYSLPDQKRALFCQLRGRGETSQHN